MRKFYVTYGNNLYGKYSVVSEQNMVKARNYVFGKIGGKFSTMYTEEQWRNDAGDFFTAGDEIPLQPMEV
jgi:hypothetical protein